MIGRAPARCIVGMGLKMYCSHARIVEWCAAVAQIARNQGAVIDQRVELFVRPGYLSIQAAREILGDRVAVGAQNLSRHDMGAFTAEVSGARLAEMGCTLVEVGHAELRRRFSETDRIVRAKITAAPARSRACWHSVLGLGRCRMHRAGSAPSARRHGRRALRRVLRERPTAIGWTLDEAQALTLSTACC